VSRIRKKPTDVDVEKVTTSDNGKGILIGEIKILINDSKDYNLHTLLGQYNFYTFFVEQKEKDRKLFLALSDEMFIQFFKDLNLDEICPFFNVEFIIFDTSKIEIVSWIKKTNNLTD
jgi:XisH protein